MREHIMPFYAIDGVIPVVDPTAYVHPEAVVIGDVIIGANCYIGPCASLRGDFSRITLHKGVNVQDCCVIHGFPGHDVIIEENGHIGHGAILHSCSIRHGALVGMNAVVMDDVDVGEKAIIAACAFVKASMKIPPRTLVAGIPARIIRNLTEQEMEWKQEGTKSYQDLTGRCLASMVVTKPLSQIESMRPLLKSYYVEPLSTVKN